MFTASLVLLFALQAPAAPAASQTAPSAAAKPDPVDHALDLIRKQRFEPAYQELAAILKTDPENQRALSYITAMELQTGRLDECQKHVDALLAKDGKNPDVRELKGQLLMARRQWKDAEAEWRWIIGERPSSDQAHMQLAAVLLQQDRYEEALAEVTKSLEGNPKRGDTRSLRGNILASLNRMDDAALDWNIALVHDPDDTVALAGLAVYLRLRDPDLALTYAKRAVELTGERTLGPIRVLTVIYKARGENDKARALLERAILRFPNNEALSAELGSLRGVPNGKPPVATASVAAPPKVAAKPPEVKATRPAPPPPETKTTPAPPPETKTAGPAPPPAPKSAATKAASTAPVPALVVPAPVVPSAPLPAPTPALPALALSGATLGASVADLLVFEAKPLPPAPEKDKVVATLAPRAPANPKTKPASKDSVDSPPPELFWGRLPLSTITPAFVYAIVPPPDQTSLGEAARRIREKQPPKP